MSDLEKKLLRFLIDNSLEFIIDERGDVVLRSTFVLDTDYINLSQWINEE